MLDTQVRCEGENRKPLQSRGKQTIAVFLSTPKLTRGHPAPHKVHRLALSSVRWLLHQIQTEDTCATCFANQCPQNSPPLMCWHSSFDFSTHVAKSSHNPVYCQGDHSTMYLFPVETLLALKWNTSSSACGYLNLSGLILVTLPIKPTLGHLITLLPLEPHVLAFLWKFTVLSDLILTYPLACDELSSFLQTHLKGWSWGLLLGSAPSGPDCEVWPPFHALSHTRPPLQCSCLHCTALPSAISCLSPETKSSLMSVPVLFLVSWLFSSVTCTESMITQNSKTEEEKKGEQVRVREARRKGAEQYMLLKCLISLIEVSSNIWIFN